MKKRTKTSEVRVVVEVDGSPIGVLSLDIGRLWPLINHRMTEDTPADWIDRRRFEAVMRAVIARDLSTRLQDHLYSALGNEIVKAELEIESFTLKAEAVAQEFGRTRKEIEKFVAKTGHTADDFYDFFWNYMTHDAEGLEPKKAWRKAARKR